MRSITDLVIASILVTAAGSGNANRGVPVREVWDIEHFCFRRLNETHQVGCSASYSGNVGIVHFVNSDSDAEYVTTHAPPAMYVPVIPDVLISVKYLDDFARSKRVAGVIISQNGSTPVAFSSDDTCPNRQSSFSRNISECSWNDHSDNKMSAAFMRDYPFPIFLISNRTILNNISQCFSTFNLPTTKASTFENRKCAVKLFSPMNAAVNTKTCIRRSSLATFITNPKGFCDPLGDHNVMTIVPAWISENADSPPKFANKTIIVAARMDTFSMFDNIAPGADSAVTGIVSILAIADAIVRYNAKEEDASRLHKNVQFTLFNGEAFDYIGSSRYVYDLLKQKAAYEMTMQNISWLIELNQLIPADSKAPMWYAHVDKQQYRDNNETKHQLDLILAQLAKGNKVTAVKNGTLPPASAHSFLKVSSSLPSVVVTNHGQRYTNKYYNSLFDDYPHRSADLSALAGNIEMIVKKTTETILALARDPADQTQLKFDINRTLIGDLLYCYLRNSSCPLFIKVVNEQAMRLLREKPYQLYVGVTNPPSKIHPSTRLTYLVMAWLTGQVVNNVTSLEACYRRGREHPRWRFDWMFGSESPDEKQGHCIRHKVVSPIARSPYFDHLYDEAHDNDLAYSSWTESVWTSAHLELFVQASGFSETVAVLSGTFIFIFSSIISVLLYRQADLIFDQAAPVAC